MKNKITVKGIWEILKESFGGFSEHKITKLSASLAYYTVFSLGPLLIVIIYLCSIFLGKEAIEGTIYQQMQGFVGKDAAAQIEQIIKNASVTGKGGIAAVIGVVTLLIGASTMFGEMQDSINSIWGLKAKPKLGLAKLIQSRLLSFGMIGSLGFLLLVSLAATTVVESLGDRLKSIFPDVAVVLFYIINLVLTLGVVTALFAFIFKVLPDATIKWKHIWGGAIATALLFLLGKFAISFYISKSNVGSTYGAAGSLVVILLWIYYSSIILYFGAEFTKAYVLKYAGPIHPNKYAVVMHEVEVEAGKTSIQEKEKQKEQIIQGKQPLPVSNESTSKVAGVPEKAKVLLPHASDKKRYGVPKEGHYKLNLLQAIGGLLLNYVRSPYTKDNDQEKRMA